jgi:hypothetical protein
VQQKRVAGVEIENLERARIRADDIRMAPVRHKLEPGRAEHDVRELLFRLDLESHELVVLSFVGKPKFHDDDDRTTEKAGFLIVSPQIGKSPSPVFSSSLRLMRSPFRTEKNFWQS